MESPSLYEYLLTHPDQNNLEIRKFDKGTYIYEPGDEQSCIYLIERGAVKIGSYSADGERVIYDVLQPGETFGDLDYLDGGVEFFEFARTITSTTVLAIDLAFFKHIIFHDIVVSEWFNVAIVRRWWKAETRLLHMTRGNIQARLDNLRREYQKVIVDNEGHLHQLFDLLSHQDLADLIGSTRQTVSKKLRNSVETVIQSVN